MSLILKVPLKTTSSNAKKKKVWFFFLMPCIQTVFWGSGCEMTCIFSLLYFSETRVDVKESVRGQDIFIILTIPRWDRREIKASCRHLMATQHYNSGVCTTAGMFADVHTWACDRTGIFYDCNYMPRSCQTFHVISLLSTETSLNICVPLVFMMFS